MLLERARREVDDGLLPSVQIALAFEGEVVAFETYGDATDETRYVVYSATKAFVAGAMWALIGDGLVDPLLPVVAYVPEFGTNGKDVVTVEQVMLHTAGFPQAPLTVLDGDTQRRARRRLRPLAARLGAGDASTSTTRPPPTGCWPRSSSGSPATTSATSSSSASRRRPACPASSATPRSPPPS